MLYLVGEQKVLPICIVIRYCIVKVCVRITSILATDNIIALEGQRAETPAVRDSETAEEALKHVTVP